MMTEKAKVHALPTEQAGFPRLGLNEWDNTWHLVKSSDTIPHTPYHLYFTSDEEIKKGDWILDYLTGFIQQVKEDWMVEAFRKDKLEWRKIVATTNKELWFHNYKRPELLKDAPVQDFMPSTAKIPDDFVAAFVREEGKIEEVLLEMEGYVTSTTWEHDEPEGYRLKLRPNGTVIIHKVKQRVWTDEEVQEMLSNYGIEVLTAAINKEKIPFSQDWFQQYKTSLINTGNRNNI